MLMVSGQTCGHYKDYFCHISLFTVTTGPDNAPAPFPHWTYQTTNLYTHVYPEDGGSMYLRNIDNTDHFGKEDQL
jgi:hypothetical protein